jgi:hypothetical protein
LLPALTAGADVVRAVLVVPDAMYRPPTFDLDNG